MQPLEDAVVTITGGTGSFGSTMASHLLQRGASRVNIFSRDGRRLARHARRSRGGARDAGPALRVARRRGR